MCRVQKRAIGDVVFGGCDEEKEAEGNDAKPNSDASPKSSSLSL
jgi:hypothetical protein